MHIKMKRILWIILLLSISISAVTGLLASLTMSSGREHHEEENVTWILKWVKHLDPVNNSTIDVKSLSSRDEIVHTTVLSWLPELFIIKVRTGEILFRTGEFKPPLFGIQVPLPSIYTDASKNGRYVAWLTPEPPTLHVYSLDKDVTRDISLKYIPDARPVSIRIIRYARWILIGDANGYAACYFFRPKKPSQFLFNGVKSLTLRYIGHDTVNIEVYYNSTYLIVEYTEPVTYGDQIKINAKDLPDGKLGEVTIIKIYDSATGELIDKWVIYTSGSEPLEVGMIFGDLEVKKVKKIP